MKTVYFRSALLCSLLVVALLYGCRGNQTTQTRTETPEFASGQVVVKTDSTVTLS